MLCLSHMRLVVTHQPFQICQNLPHCFQDSSNIYVLLKTTLKNKLIIFWTYIRFVVWEIVTWNLGVTIYLGFMLLCTTNDHWLMGKKKCDFKKLSSIWMKLLSDIACNLIQFNSKSLI
jgi:hypothetical protein